MELVTTKEAAEMLGIKPQTILVWRMKGKVSPVSGSKGAKLRFRKSDIRNLLTKKNRAS